MKTNEPIKKENEDGKERSRKGSVRTWIAISLCFLVLIAGISVYVSSRQPSSVSTHQKTWTDLGFDTPVSFQATCTDEEFEDYCTLVESLYRGYNAQFDQYNFYEGINNVAVLNEEACEHPVEVEDCLIELLELGIRYGELNPKLDITEGKVLSLWHDAREAETPYVPDADAIAQARIHDGVEAIEISGNEVSFSDPNLQLDLGAIAKGYTTQIVKEQLEKAGLESGYLNAGGNVVLIGEKADGSDWIIGIQDPDGSSSVVQVALAKPMAVVTSGDYQRYMEVDGVRYSHIIDPDTGYPADTVRSVTVIDEDSAKADAMSTALFCMSVEDGMQFAQDNSLSVIWIADKGSDTCTLEPTLTTASYNIYATESLADLVQLSR